MYFTGEAKRVRFDFPVRRPSYRFRHAPWPVLPLPLSGTASAGACTFLRRRRRPRRSARNRRLHPGDGNDQADPRPRGKSDRKSTRLNSSHGYISYAVFCLKKKKKKNSKKKEKNERKTKKKRKK